MDLSNKQIVVTGAKGGLGAYITQALLAANARVIGVSRSIQRSDFPHPRFSAVAAELASIEAAETLVTSLRQEYETIDGLVHLLGGFDGGKSVEETDDSSIEKMLALNFRSAFYIIRAVLPLMKQQHSGAIVAIGARTAFDPASGLAAYSASKAALISLMRTVSVEVKDHGISANVILPGTIDTPANRASSPGTDTAKWIRPEQIASLVVHLMGDCSSQLTGAVIPLYGAGL